METWNRVKWTEASQVTEAMDGRISVGAETGAPPDVFFKQLIDQGHLHDAAYFLGAALSRLDAIAWAVHVTSGTLNDPGQSPDDQKAIAIARAWVRNPEDDGLRRAAREASQRANRESPARLAALSVFFSGGSIAPPQLQAAPAPRDVAGRLAAAAVILSATQSENPPAFLKSALALGDKVATSGYESLSL